MGVCCHANEFEFGKGTLFLSVTTDAVRSFCHGITAWHPCACGLFGGMAPPSCLVLTCNRHAGASGDVPKTRFCGLTVEPHASTPVGFRCRCRSGPRPSKGRTCTSVGGAATNGATYDMAERLRRTTSIWHTNLSRATATGPNYNTYDFFFFSFLLSSRSIY